MGGLRSALLLCLLVAIAWQSCLTQIHNHAERTLRAFSPLVSLRADSGGGRNLPDTPATCPICQEAALSGQYVATVPVLLAPPALAMAWYHLAASRPSHRDLKSHAWHSRAPPPHSTLSTA